MNDSYTPNCTTTISTNEYSSQVSREVSTDCKSSSQSSNVGKSISDNQFDKGLRTAISETQPFESSSKYPRIQTSEDLLLVDRIPGGGIPGTDNIVLDAAWVKVLSQEEKETNTVPETSTVIEEEITLEDFLKESVVATKSSTVVELDSRSSPPENPPLDNYDPPSTQSASDLHVPATTSTENDERSSSHDIDNLTPENTDFQVDQLPKDCIDEANVKIGKPKRKRKAKKVEIKVSSKKPKQPEKDNTKSTETNEPETDLVTAFTNTIAESAMKSCLQMIAVNEGLTHLRDIIVESVCKNITKYFLRMGAASYFYETQLKQAQSSAIFLYARDLLRKRLILPRGRIPRDILHLHQINHLEKLINSIRTKSIGFHDVYSSTAKNWKNLDPDDMLLHAEKISSEYYRRTRERIPGIDIIAILLLCPSRIAIYRYYIKDKRNHESLFFKCINFIRHIAELGGLATCLFARDQFVLEKVLPLFPEQLEVSARDFGRLSLERQEGFRTRVKSLCEDFCNESDDEKEKNYKGLLVSSLSLNFKVFGSLVASGNQNRERVLPAVVNALILESTSESKIPNISAWVKLFFRTSFGIKVMSFVRRQPQEMQFSMYEKVVSTFVALVSKMPSFLKEEGFKDPLKIFQELGEAELDILQVEDESLCKILNSVMDIVSRHFDFDDSFKEFIANDKSKEISEEIRIRKEQEVYTVEMMKKYSDVKIPMNSTETDLSTLIDESFNHPIAESFRVIKFPSVGELTPTGEVILNDSLDTFWTFMKVDLSKSTLFQFFLQCPLLFTNGYEDFVLNGSITGEPIQAMVNLMQMISFPNYDFKSEFIQSRKNIFFGSLISSFRLCYGGQLEEGQMTPYIQALADGFRVLYRMQDIRLQRCPEGMMIYGCLLSFISECKDIDISALGKELVNTIRCHRLDSNVTVDFTIIVQRFLQRFCKEVKDYYLIMSKETSEFFVIQ